MARPRFRIVNTGRDHHYDPSTDEVAVEVYDRTCAVESAAWDCGEDFILVWDRTLSAAVAQARRRIEDGTIVKHFDDERARWIKDHGACGWDEPMPGRPVG